MCITGWISRKQTLRWRLVWGRFIWECSWDQHLWREGREGRGREKLSCDVISEEPQQWVCSGSTSRMALQSCPGWGNLYIPVLIGYGPPQKETGSWVRQFFPAEALSSGKTHCSKGTKSFVPEGRCKGCTTALSHCALQHGLDFIHCGRHTENPFYWNFIHWSVVFS